MISRKTICAAVVGTSILSGAAPAFAATCMVFDPGWRQQHVVTQTALTDQVLTMQAALTASMTATAEMLVSGAKVYTTQVDTDGQRQNLARTSTNEALASSLNQQDRNLKMLKAQEEYGIGTGQGVDACATVAMMSRVSSVLEESPSAARGAIAALDVAPGRAPTANEAVKTRLGTLKKTNADVLFNPQASGEDRNAVITHMAGMPPAKPEERLKSIEADAMMMRARQIEALRSPALVSLNAVSSMNSKVSHGHVVSNSGSPHPLTGAAGGTKGDGATSLAEVLDELIDRYGGGPSYEKWSAGLVGQSERGLLIELTRLRGLSTQLKQADTDQRSRLTAIAATQLALEAGGL